VENPDVIKPQFFCTIEGAYFSRPDSTFPVIGPDGKLKFVSFYMIRKALGRRTAIEHPVPHADMVIPVPRSGIPAAIGYSHEAKIPYESALINEGQIGRTFIESDYQARVRLADEKYSGVPDMFEEKRVVVIDDSLIRALTMKTIIQKLRDLGALEVHVRIPAPEVILSCYYGVDTKRAFELVAHDKNKEELRLAAGAPDSLEFISKKGFREVLSVFHPRGLCMACFDGKYPIPVK
jgi:amidophosphoribosyltransferase